MINVNLNENTSWSVYQKRFVALRNESNKTEARYLEDAKKIFNSRFFCVVIPFIKTRHEILPSHSFFRVSNTETRPTHFYSFEKKIKREQKLKSYSGLKKMEKASYEMNEK